MRKVQSRRITTFVLAVIGGSMALVACMVAVAALRSGSNDKPQLPKYGMPVPPSEVCVKSVERKNASVVGVAGTNVIERYWDGYGRNLGYSLNGERRAALAYEPDTGRIASMFAAGSTNLFRWTYLPGSDQKETLAYPNGDMVRWEYEPQRDLLTLVSNATHSSYRYTYDAAGRRGSKNDERYGYNVRGELVLATNVVNGTVFAYEYDDIGNRRWAYEFGTNTTYEANSLNQYTEIVRGGVAEHPAFDADGNQTKIAWGNNKFCGDGEENG